jgi:hypothetical protein
VPPSIERGTRHPPDGADPGEAVDPADGGRDHGTHRLRGPHAACCVGWASTSAGPKGGRPPVGVPAKRASRGGQSIDLRLEQLVIHGQLTDLALEPRDLDVAVVRWPRSEGGLAASEKGIAPSAQLSCCHAMLAIGPGCDDRLSRGAVPARHLLRGIRWPRLLDQQRHDGVGPRAAQRQLGRGTGSVERGARAEEAGAGGRADSVLPGQTRPGPWFKDWTDYQAFAQALGVGDGTTKTFQLVKHYPSGGVIETRVIAKPVAGSVKLYRDGVEAV